MAVPLKILIVEDMLTIRLLLGGLIRAALRPERPVLLEAPDGQAGLDTALREQPDLVISDISMPKMDGLTLCKRLREAPAAVQPLFEAIAGALAPGGMLCLAPTDPQPEPRLLSRDPVHPSIYWKGPGPAELRAVERCDPGRRGAPPWTMRAQLEVADGRGGEGEARTRPGDDRDGPPRGGAGSDGGETTPRRAASPAALGAPPEPLSDARRLADAGRLEEALALLGRPGADARAVPQLVLRGQLCLSGGHLKDARHDFRRALYLAPEHLWARYWLTLTQLREGHADAARVQLRELERQLASRPGGEQLADGPGTVDELRGAVAELKGRLQ